MDQENQYNEEWFCIDGSGVLAAYGLRDCNDLDFLHYDNEIVTTDTPGIESHNFQRDYHAITIDDILFDPDYHFFYNGIKFCTLPLVKKMKINRGEDKDWRDIDLIQTIPDSRLTQNKKEGGGFFYSHPSSTSIWTPIHYIFPLKSTNFKEK